MAALLLAALLTPACCPLPAGRAADPSAPIGSLQVERNSSRLTWSLQGNASGVMCFSSFGAFSKAQGGRFCQFPWLPACAEATFTVTVTRPRLFSASVQLRPHEGTPGAEATGLECWVHDVTVLTCRWGAGPAAPPDVQYRLYWEDLGSGEERECAGYQVDERGARVGCSFGDVSWASDQLQRFLVRGSAAGSAVPCSEVVERLADVERLSPPKLNCTCEGPRAVLRWEPPSRLQKLLLYELQVQKDARPPELVRTVETSLVLPNPGDFAVRIKAQSVLPRRTASEWGAPQYFNCDAPSYGSQEVIGGGGEQDTPQYYESDLQGVSPWLQEEVLLPIPIPVPDDLEGSAWCSHEALQALKALLELGALLATALLLLLLVGGYSVPQKRIPPRPPRKPHSGPTSRTVRRWGPAGAPRTPGPPGSPEMSCTPSPAPQGTELHLLP